MPLYFLDTNILIDVAGERKSHAFFARAFEQPHLRLGTSVLCVAEFMAGAGAKEEGFLKAWIKSGELEIFSLDSWEDAARAGEMRKKHALALPDALILTSAIHARAHLLTHDSLFLKKARPLITVSDPLEPIG